MAERLRAAGTAVVQTREPRGAPGAEAMLESDGPGETKIPFGETYDLKTVKPLPKFEASLMAVKEDLASMGMPYK